MLKLNIAPVELFNSDTNEFYTVPSQGEYRFEHSLRAISEWESIYCVPFLEGNEKTTDMMLTYFQCMCLTDIDKRLLTTDVVKEITDYLASPQTATHIDMPHEENHGTYTSSELIYALMVEAGIPFECDTWNLNRLINVLTIVQQRRSPKKMKSKRTILEEQRALNEQRRARLHTKG